MKVAFQMDPLEDLNHKTDSTIALIEAAINLGAETYFYARDTLSADNLNVFAKVERLNLESKILNKGEIKKTNLKEFDIIFLRDEPPFDMSYITSTYILERLHKHVKMLNDPVSVRNSPEKLSALNYSQYMVETLVTQEEQELNNFISSNGKSVIKPLHSFGGQDIFIIENFNELAKAHSTIIKKHPNLPIMIQKFIPNIVKGDKRVLLFDGVILGAVNRVPSKDSYKANLVAGGKAEATVLTERELEISNHISVDLKKAGIIFAGIDLIDGYLTEINVTCPTGIQSINQIHNLKGDQRIENVMMSKILSYA